MKKILTFLFTILAGSVMFSQAQNPVSWSAVYKSLSATEGEIIITGNIEKGWHTYSQRPTDAGPIPTSFTFTPSKSYKLKGKTEESDAHEEFVKAFDAKIYVFTGKAEFHQKITVTGKNFTIPVKIEYMSCNDMMCLPPKTTELQVKVGQN
jgi:DsbC/DsbD-like thiol-disulfide interchange protein